MFKKLNPVSYLPLGSFFWSFPVRLMLGRVLSLLVLFSGWMASLAISRLCPVVS